MDYDSIIPEILVKEYLHFYYLVGMIADQNFYDICFTFFILRLRPTAKAEDLRPTATVVEV